MVKKYFRRFIAAACAAMSIMYSAGSVYGAYAIAAETEMTDVAEPASETETIPEETAAEEHAEKNEETSAADESEETSAPEESTETPVATASETQENTDADNLNMAEEGQDNGNTETPSDGPGESADPEDGSKDSGDEFGDDSEDSEGSGEKEDSEDGSDEGSGEASEDKSKEESEDKSDESEKEPEEDAHEVASPTLKYDKESYVSGDTIVATIGNVKDEKASKAVVTYNIPNGAKFSNVVVPTGVKTSYKDDSGNWADYSTDISADSVKTLRFAIDAKDNKVALGGDIVVAMEVVTSASGSTEVKAEYTEEKKTVEKSTSANLSINALAVDITMSQFPEVPTYADEIRQNVTVTYGSDEDSVITYNVDPSLDVKGIEVGSNTYLEGGTAVVTSDAGESEVSISASMDLSSYTNVTKIVFAPKSRAYDGMTASFTAVLGLKNSAAGPGAISPISEYTCSAEVTASSNGFTVTKNASVTSQVAAANVITPELSLSYDGTTYSESVSSTIAFGKSFSLNLGKFGTTGFAYSTGSYAYSVTTPAFVTLKEITLPKLDGANEVAVIVVDKDGNESAIGKYAPGETISVDKSGVASVRFEIVPTADSVSVTKNGSIVFVNNLEENKDGSIQNASFRAVGKVVVNGTEYAASSKIITANIRNYKRSESDVKDQTNKKNDDNSSNTGGNTTNGGDTNSGDNTKETEETEPETENPDVAERKKQETDRKEQAKTEALQNEQKMKSKLSTLLANRVSQVKSKALSSGSSTATVTSKSSDPSDPYADWTVKPIKESIISNLVPEELNPIEETIVASTAADNNIIVS